MWHVRVVDMIGAQGIGERLAWDEAGKAYWDQSVKGLGCHAMGLNLAHIDWGGPLEWRVIRL